MQQVNPTYLQVFKISKVYDLRLPIVILVLFPSSMSTGIQSKEICLLVCLSKQTEVTTLAKNESVYTAVEEW